MDAGRGGLLFREDVVRRRRLPRVRFIRPSWNAKRCTCEKCGAIEEQDGRLLVRLNVCMMCIEEGQR